MTELSLKHESLHTVCNPCYTSTRIIQWVIILNII